MFQHPYVYKLVHKRTGQYYFGFRCSNRVPASDDLGIKYFTSSRTIKEIGFENFDRLVLAEFFDKQAAFEFETELIAEHISDVQCLNKALNGKLCPIRKHTTLEHRQNLSKALAGKKRKRSEQQTISHKAFIASLTEQERKELFGSGGKKAQITISKMSPEERSSKFGSMKGKTPSTETIEKQRVGNIGKTISEEAKRKMSLKKLGVKQKPEVVSRRSEKHSGGGNPRAIQIVLFDVQYSCKKEAREALGWSKQKLTKFLIGQKLPA